jgi:putative membrane protein
MKHILTQSQRDGLNQAVSDAEKRTGAQIVLAVVRRSDAYPEIPWMAFSLAAAVSGLAVCATGAFRGGWTAVFSPSGAAIVIPGAGAVFALLSVLFPAFGRLFLAPGRSESEVRQYAESFFLRRGLSATAGRRGVLLLVSLFERRVIVLPDEGLRPRLDGGAIAAILRAMRLRLRRGDVHAALEAGLEDLARTLEHASPAAGGAGRNELPDAVIEEKGA